MRQFLKSIIKYLFLNTIKKGDIVRVNFEWCKICAGNKVALKTL